MEASFSSKPSSPLTNSSSRAPVTTFCHNVKNIEKPKTWLIRASPKSLATINPIRVIVDNLNLTPNKDKPFIPLAIGDPTRFGNFKPCPEIVQAMIDAVNSYQFNGYQPTVGSEEARQSVADHCANYGMNVNYKDVILSSGCSHALDMAMTVFAIPGCNMLVPRPGFSLYKTLATMLDIELRHYDLMPQQNWQIDLDDLESKIDDQTVAIIYNNPSNPCGSVFSRQHILNFLLVAERNCLPIIADEIYEDIVFSNHKFHAIASLTDQVPVLHCSGTTKKFMIPGWRLGWIVINDQHQRFGPDIRNSLNSLSQRLIGPNALVQGALKTILTKCPRSFFDEAISTIQANARLAFNRLENICGLKPIEPSGAFYMMVNIKIENFPAFRNGLQFVEKLVSEESVFCLPGECFDLPGYVRLVLCVDTEMLDIAIDRIESFCQRYYVN